MIGVIVVNKPKNISSNGVVVKIKKILNEKKVGHLGTLDPLAQGVLPICVGRATRIFNYFLNKRKTYIATFEFGKQTDTLDLEGDIIQTSSYIPNVNEIKNVIKKNLLGKILQTPPIYSSKKINGKNAYQLARKGQDIQLKSCCVEIFSFNIIEKISNSIYRFEIECSAGTYIRSLARDLGHLCNSCATMIDLIRIKSGPFNINNLINFEDLSFENIQKNILGLEEVLKDFDKITINTTTYQKIRNGIKFELSLPKLQDKEYLVYCENDLVGIGKVKNNYLKINTYLV